VLRLVVAPGMTPFCEAVMAACMGYMLVGMR
jgi:hypothetical protein